MWWDVCGGGVCVGCVWGGLGTPVRLSVTVFVR